MSILAEIEAAVDALPLEQKKKLLQFLESRVNGDREAKRQLRRQHHSKLPDAVVCATAMELGVELWTNDATLAKVPGLTCRAVSLTKP